MGYRIEYDIVGKLPKKRTRNWTALVAGTLVILLVFGAMAVKSVGLKWVQDVLLPGDPAVIAAALEDAAQDLRSGESLGDAIQSFCEEIMKHAQTIE